jgi:S1-C subfamily serine protease
MRLRYKGDMTGTAILGTMLLLLAPGPGAAQTGAKSPQPSKPLADYSAAMENLAQSASPAVVQILVQTLAPLGNGDSQRAGFVSEREATGSGVIVDPDGYIVTNAHVVRNARRIDVNILRSDERGEEPHGHLVPAKLIGLDRQVDIAVVKIEGKNLPALSFVDSDNLREIQRGKERMSKTVAVLERKSEPSQMEDLANSATLVRQLGILAVTVDEKVTAILPDLRRLSGVAVAAVPAEYAGLNPGLVAGDVIYSVNNQRIASLDELRDALKDKKSGDAIALLVERFGQLIYVTAALE